MSGKIHRDRLILSNQLVMMNSLDVLMEDLNLQVDPKTDVGLHRVLQQRRSEVSIARSKTQQALQEISEIVPDQPKRSQRHRGGRGGEAKRRTLDRPRSV